MAKDWKPGDWLTRKQAAEYLLGIGCPISKRTLDNYAADDNAGGGPNFRRVRERIIRYRRSELDAWAYKNTKDVK